VVETDLEPLVSLSVQLVVCREESHKSAADGESERPMRRPESELTLVANLLRGESLLGSHHLSRGTVLVSSADLQPAGRRRQYLQIEPGCGKTGERGLLT